MIERKSDEEQSAVLRIVGGPNRNKPKIKQNIERIYFLFGIYSNCDQ